MKEIQLTQGKVAIVDDGDFEWLNQWKWHYNKHTGYACRKDWRGKKYIMMHRLINGTPEGMHTDHISRDTLDNRRCNLRDATPSQNGQNRIGMPETQSAFKGLSFYEDHFYVRIVIDGINTYLGRFKDEHLAAQVYDYAAREHHKEFARPNLPNEVPLSIVEFERLTKRHQAKSHFRGVSIAKGKWIAYIQVKGKFKHLGYYSSELEAAQVYNEAAIKYHGNRAKLNKVQEQL